MRGRSGFARVFARELKKIWTPGAVLALVAAGVLSWWLWGWGPISMFPNGSQAASELKLALDWRARFGADIDAAELGQIEDDYDLVREEFECTVAEVPGAAEAGVTSWESYLAFSERLRSEYDRLAIGGSMEVDPDSELGCMEEVAGAISSLPACMKMQELDLWMSSLSEALGVAPARGGSAASGARASRDDAAPQGYLSLMWLQNLEVYGGFLATWLVMAPAFVAAPVAMRDRLYRMRFAQWSSRTGRRGIFGAQLAAVLLSICMVLAVSVALWVLPFAFTEVPALLDCTLAGPRSGYDCRWPVTLGGYIAARLALMMFLGVASGLVSFLLARTSTGYVGMLLRLVPWCAGLGFVMAPALFDHALCVQRSGVDMFGPLGSAMVPGFEAVLVCAVLVLAAVACAFAYRRQLRSDLKA